MKKFLLGSLSFLFIVNAYAENISNYEKLCEEKGDAKSCYKVALHYAHPSRDIEKAIEFANEICASGYAPGCILAIELHKRKGDITKEMEKIYYASACLTADNLYSCKKVVEDFLYNRK